MKKALVLPALVFIILSGCVSQSYYQKINPDGSSSLNITIDYSKMIAASAENKIPQKEALTIAEKAFEEACRSAVNAGKGCSHTSSSITFLTNYPKHSYFYETEVSQSIIGTNYKTTIKKIPREEFEKVLLGGASAVKNTAIQVAKEPAEDIDLLDKQTNRQIAFNIKTSGAYMLYSVEMPAPISSAKSGNISATIDGNVARFDVGELLEDSEYIVVEANQFNPFLLVAAILIIILVLSWKSLASKRRTER